jgi:lysophospholipase L1-like esterase
MRKPDDYEERQTRYAERLESGSNEDILEIKIPTQQFKGYIKINPDYEWEGVQINSSGFRGEEIGNKEKYRVVCLGGSTTFGVGNKDNETYPHYLEEITGYEVINCGIGGANIENIKNMFEKEILPFKPDLIIINSVLNNLYYYAPTYQDRSMLCKINNFFIDRILLYMTAREKLAIISKGSCSDLYKAPLSVTVKCFLNDDKFWNDIKESYKYIIDKAEEHNIRVLLIKQPIKLGGNTILFDEKMLPVYEKMHEMLDESGETIDAFTYFNENPDDLFSPDNLHLTSYGNKKLAELIADKIANEN